MTLRAHAPFSLVLSGGGARGFVHAGVLRALERMGCPPDAVVGVSMGAIVGATYALNPDWYRSLIGMDLTGVPRLPSLAASGVREMLRNLYEAERFISQGYFGWGIGQKSVDWGMDQLRRLTLGRLLEEGRLPVCVTATDIDTGERVAFRSGQADRRLYASSALAGILPPAEIDGRLLIDGGYADLAPVDIARQLIDGPTIVIDAASNLHGGTPKNGLQAMIRGIEICQNRHAALRFTKAEMVLTPTLSPPIDTLDFGQKRRAVAAGLRLVRSNASSIGHLIRIDSGHETHSSGSETA